MLGMHLKYTGVLVIAAGCALDPKTVGMGTDTDVEDGSGSASEASATDDPSGSGSESESVSASSTSPSTSASTDESDTGCEGANCAWDPGCSELACGAFCYPCNPDDPECGLPGTYTVCTDQGTCDVWPNWDEDPCPGQGLEQGFELDLGPGGGCGDMYLNARNEDDTQILIVQIDGLVAMAEAAGETIMVEYAGNDPALEITAQHGMYLESLACTDVIENDPVIEERWVASQGEDGDAGTVVITVTPTGDGYADATVTLDGIYFVREVTDVFDVPIVLEHFEFTDVSVGWEPG